jgi:hypothetical protein
VELGDVVTWVLAAAAIIVSLVTFSRQHGLQRRLTVIEEARREEEVEARSRADVTAHVLSGRLVLKNMGPAPAFSVDVSLQPSVPQLPKLHLEGHTLPVPRLDPGGEYKIMLITALGVPPEFGVDLRWRDEAGDQRKQLTLSLR